MTEPRIVFLDIETSPMETLVWSLREPHIGTNQVIKPPRVICMAWKWKGEPVQFDAEWLSGKRTFVRQVWKVLDEADVIVHYNGRSFDVPHLNREFLEIGLKPPAPYAQLDLYRTIRSVFNFPSNRLEYVVGKLTENEKIKTDMDLWKGVRAKDGRACAQMKKYNERDVEVLEDLYARMLPWIKQHPNVALYQDSEGLTCSVCSSPKLERRGFSYTATGKYQRYQCKKCGKWMRGTSRIATTGVRDVVS